MKNIQIQGFSTKQLQEWYVLLRRTQGDLFYYKEDLTHMIDNGDFLKDSLFCEHAYIINLDDNNLEIYTGFNRNVNALGRYSNFKVDNSVYYGVSLFRTVSLADIRKIGDIKNYCEEIERGRKIDGN